VGPQSDQVTYSTPPDDYEHAAFAGDVGFDIIDEPDSGDVSDDCPAYSHGYSLRVELLCSAETAGAALGRLGWAPDSADWIASQPKGAERWSIRGLTFVTQRAPRNKRLPLARRNKEWRTRLYSLQIDRRPGGAVFLDLHGVRRGDVERLLERIMQLGPSEYAIRYYRAAERFFVLPAYEALRLGVALGQVPHNGRGRLAGKRFLASDVAVPIRVKTRTRRLATLSVYRIRRGATAAYKVELRLAGKSRDRGTFQEADIAKLDDALAALIAEHDLHPIGKPARWEPCGPARWSRDGQLERLGSSAYRGWQASRELIGISGDCHTPEVRFLGEMREDTVASLGLPYIRQDSTPSSSSDSDSSSFDSDSGGSQLEVTNPARESLPPEGRLTFPKEAKPGHPDMPPKSASGAVGKLDANKSLWDALAKDISAHEGFLSEVILDSHQDPMPLVRALDRADSGTVALHALCPVNPDGHARTWGTVSDALAAYPGTSRTRTLVVVVDAEILWSAREAVYIHDEHSGRSVPGPLLYPNWQWETTPLLIKATAGWLWPMLEGLRDICEESGFRVVLVTVDARPAHGFGELRRSHFFRDARVRSHLGDAGRYWSHTRYRVEVGRGARPGRVVMVKDEAQGLMGRIIYGRSA